MSLPAVSMNQSPSGPIHKSFSAQRKLAITSTAWSNGIRVYCTHSENGTGSILEISLDQDTNSPAFDEESRHGWRSESVKIYRFCSQWGNSTSSVRNVSVFYQTNDNVIHETRFDGQNWSVSSFTELDATAGTAMAATERARLKDVPLTGNGSRPSASAKHALKHPSPLLALSPMTSLFLPTKQPLATTVFQRLQSHLKMVPSHEPTHVTPNLSVVWLPLFGQKMTSGIARPTEVQKTRSHVSFRVYMQTSDNSDMWAYKRSSDWRLTYIAAVVQNTSKGYFINLYSVNVEKTRLYRPSPRIRPPVNALIFTGSFPNPRKIGLAAAVWSNGVCSVYCSGNGHIREVSRNLVTQVDSWSDGLQQCALDGICAPGTNFCCVFWDDSNAALYYQTADSVIHEMQYNGRTWSVSTFTQSGAMPGTTLAVVQSHNADRVMIFYQNNDNFICCRRATKWVWEPAVHICLARFLAPFTVTTWSDTTDIHLFLQNNYTIQKYSGSFNGNWVKDQYSISAADPLINMTALSCPGPRIKLYVQRNDNSLLGFSYAPGAFARDIVRWQSRPRAGPTASVFTPRVATVLSVEASYDPHTTPWDQDLATRLGNIFSQADLELRHIHGWQRSRSQFTLLSAVLIPSMQWGEVGSTQNVSVFSQTRDNLLQEMRYDGQNWTLTSFIQSDVMPGTAMAETHTASCVIGGFHTFVESCWPTQSTVSPLTGSVEPAVRICQAATVTPIAATTWSNGADVRLYFQDKTNHVREFCITFRNGDLYDGDWVLGDLKMTGFLPTTQFVSNPERNEAGTNTAIAAFRSTPWGFISLYWAGSDKVQFLRQRGMHQNQWLTADLIGDLSSCGPLGAALVGPFTLTQLGEQKDCLSSSITDLGAQNGALAEFSSGTTFDQRVKDCHDQSVTVAKQFKDLYKHSAYHPSECDESCHRYNLPTVDHRAENDRVKELLAISKVMQEGEEKKAKKDAEEQRDDTEKLRIVRDVLTLGLGEAGDWGSLNDAMNYADQLIGYADTAIQASTKAKDEAQAALTSMTALAEQIHELENHALDVGLALGSLVGKSSVLPVLHTAQQLATSVLAIEAVAKTDNRLSGVFVDNPDTMDASLQAIANSPVRTSETDDESLV
ncbi:hypothetical protein B0H14DRAFT_3615918 [Mycena olivaceomarginata]|nr:hypothetical protein B0H14DRAFT_3615918 [Mycena olivaceomarginata]